MLQLKVLQNQYLILAMGAGLAVLGVLSMTYLVFRRKRSDMTYSHDNQSSWKRTRQIIPWILVLTWLGMFLYGVAMTIYSAVHPPNW